MYLSYLSCKHLPSCEWSIVVLNTVLMDDLRYEQEEDGQKKYHNVEQE